MFRHSNRGTIVWLFIVGVALGLTLVTGDVPTSIGAGLLAAYMALVIMVARNVQPGAIVNLFSNSRARPVKSTAIAQEAIARARTHPTYDALIQLLDIGLVVDEQRPDGLSLRRGRFLSLDDDGIRPFAIIHVSETLGRRVARIRYEICDETGRAQYIFEDEKWLDPGENALLPNYRFPIRKNTTGLLPGTWTVHCSIDSGLLGIHSFNLGPSLREQHQMMASDGELRERVWRTEKEDTSLPVSLEELLRQQSRQRYPN
ncbi:MAG: hypothetical protein JW966_03645 [Anaerolineae bacterium]|nr:hypothetical protein [Anaerolineae bacterium]